MTSSFSSGGKAESIDTAFPLCMVKLIRYVELLPDWASPVLQMSFAPKVFIQ